MLLTLFNVSKILFWWLKDGHCDHFLRCVHFCFVYPVILPVVKHTTLIPMYSPYWFIERFPFLRCSWLSLSKRCSAYDASSGSMCRRQHLYVFYFLNFARTTLDIQDRACRRMRELFRPMWMKTLGELKVHTASNHGPRSLMGYQSLGLGRKCRCCRDSHRFCRTPEDRQDDVCSGHTAGAIQSNDTSCVRRMMWG